MNTATPPSSAPACTAFLGTQRIAFGFYSDVAKQLAARHLEQGGGLLVFDDTTGKLVDYPWPADHAPVAPSVEEMDSTEVAGVAAPAPVGRPRLGVVAREVTLLPRHWAWLALQRGGASAALRRLVDEARKAHSAYDAQRQAKERAYCFMSAIGGGLPGFEEASRALFADDGGAFTARIRAWPEDIQTHLSWLARGAFAAN